MFKVRINKKGIVLFIVLGVVLITATLAAVVINLVLSHYRFTHHQFSRIQAYYASMAGINYAIEMLRIGPVAGGWVSTDCPSPGGCPIPNDSQLPPSIQQPILIILTPSCAPGPGCNCPTPPAPAGGACISARTVYTYTPTPP